MAQTLYIAVDTFFDDRIGGFTTNPTWVEYDLQQTGRSKEQMLKQAGSLEFPIFVYPAGGYVAILQFGAGFVKPQIAFLHFEVSIDQFFDHFADSFTPKTVQAIFDTQKVIASRGTDYQESVILIDEI